MMMDKRFQTEIDSKCSAYKIIDTEAKKYNLPEMAVSRYSNRYGDAHNVEKLLSKGWEHFVRNPR